MSVNTSAPSADKKETTNNLAKRIKETSASLQQEVLSALS